MSYDQKRILVFV